MDYRDWTASQLRAEIGQMRGRVTDARAGGRPRDAALYDAEIVVLLAALAARTLRV